MTDEFKEKIEKKKAAQHRAWLKWYSGPKGEAYRAKMKVKRGLEQEESNDTTSTGAK